MSSFGWHSHPDIWAVMIGIEALYLFALKRLGPRYVTPGEEPASRSQIALFTLGVVTMWIFADWPIHELSEDYLFSVHMIQHMAFSLVGTPLMLLGMPSWLMRLVISPRLIRPIARFVTRPVTAIVIFNGYLVFSHWPVFVDIVLTSEFAHAAAHVVLVMTALIMWWPVLSPLAEMPRLSHPAQLLYLFLQTVVPTVPASFLTFATTPFYKVYAEAPRIIAMSAVTDQRVAGLIMKLGGGFFLWGVIAVLFFRWSSREETGKPDAVDWQDIERRLNQSQAAR